VSRERDDDERPRPSWSEIDKRRDRPRARQDERRPRGAVAEARARVAAGQYLKKVEGRLFSGRGDDAAEGLTRAVHEAHGTSGLAEACRAYLEAVGPPSDARLLALFLDAKEPRVVVAGLEGLERLRSEGTLPVSPGLRSHLRMLSEEPDDDVAYAAEDLLSKL
jgi:hypothetical protein